MPCSAPCRSRTSALSRSAQRSSFTARSSSGSRFARARHRLEGLDRRVISDVLDAVSQRIGLGNPGQRHVWIADELTAPAHCKRDRNHPGKTEPTAIGNGALLGADDERTVLVEPTGGYLIDLCRVAGCKPQQFAVAA